MITPAASVSAGGARYNAARGVAQAKSSAPPGTDSVRRQTTAIHIALIALVSIATALPLLSRRTDAGVPDSQSYIVPAENLLAGRGLRGAGNVATFADSIPGYPRTPGPETLRPPVYPALIAFFLATGAGLRGVVVFQHLLNLAVAVALYLFLLRVTRSRAMALIAALVCAWFPPAAQVANQVLSETLFTALLLAAILAADLAIHRQSVSLMIAAGLLLGLATMTRPIAMYFAIPVAAVVVLCVKRRAALLAALLISSQVLPLAWTYRNFEAAGVPTFSTSAAENLLFQWAAGVHVTRNSPDLYRLTAAQQQMGFRSALHRARLPLFYQAMAIARADGADPTRLSAARKSVYERRLAIHLLRESPLALAEIILSGVVELQLFEPATVTFDYSWIPRRAYSAFVWLVFLLLVIAAAGIAAIHRRDRPLALLIAVTIAYFTATASIPETSLRYALAYLPLYAAALAAGIVELAESHVRRGGDAASSRASRAATNGPS